MATYNVTVWHVTLGSGVTKLMVLEENTTQEEAIDIIKEKLPQGVSCTVSAVKAKSTYHIFSMVHVKTEDGL